MVRERMSSAACRTATVLCDPPRSAPVAPAGSGAPRCLAGESADRPIGLLDEAGHELGRWHQFGDAPDPLACRKALTARVDVGGRLVCAEVHHLVGEGPAHLV